ncbi:MAG: hypothetical protein WD844_03175 [Thermoleophilaceae bacterium]
MTLAERLVLLHRTFADAGIPHAFGGAIALAYWTLEPRGTRDLDVNVFLPAEAAAGVLTALPSGVDVPASAPAAIRRDGQVRVWWDDTPVDLFFDYALIHGDAARNARDVPFEGTTIPVLGPVELAVFKAMFDRTRDWADIEAMLAAASTSHDEIAAALRPMVGDEDPRWARLRAAADGERT